MVTIRAVRDEADVATVRALFREYQEGLVAAEGKAAEAHICFQDFEAELGRLGEMYGPPKGVLLMAEDADGPVGCVGVRATQEPGVCEMKRLYLRTRARGSGAGRRLAEAALDAAKDAGYQKMVLDTLPSMQVAIGLYRSMGFTARDPYYEGAPVETVYFERAL